MRRGPNTIKGLYVSPHSVSKIRAVVCQSSVFVHVFIYTLTTLLSLFPTPTLLIVKDHGEGRSETQTVKCIQSHRHTSKNHC